MHYFKCIFIGRFLCSLKGLFISLLFVQNLLICGFSYLRCFLFSASCGFRKRGW